MGAQRTNLRRENWGSLSSPCSRLPMATPGSPLSHAGTGSDTSECVGQFGVPPFYGEDGSPLWLTQVPSVQPSPRCASRLILGTNTGGSPASGRRTGGGQQRPPSTPNPEPFLTPSRQAAPAPAQAPEPCQGTGVNAPSFEPASTSIRRPPHATSESYTAAWSVEQREELVHQVG